VSAGRESAESMEGGDESSRTRSMSWGWSMTSELGRRGGSGGWAMGEGGREVDLALMLI
jgi:hypothetical protein